MRSALVFVQLSCSPVACELLVVCAVMVDITVCNYTKDTIVADCSPKRRYWCWCSTSGGSPHKSHSCWLLVLCQPCSVPQRNVITENEDIYSVSGNVKAAKHLKIQLRNKRFGILFIMWKRTVFKDTSVEHTYLTHWTLKWCSIWTEVAAWRNSSMHLSYDGLLILETNQLTTTYLCLFSLSKSLPHINTLCSEPSEQDTAFCTAAVFVSFTLMHDEVLIQQRGPGVTVNRALQTHYLQQAETREAGHCAPEQRWGG